MTFTNKMAYTKIIPMLFVGLIILLTSCHQQENHMGETVPADVLIVGGGASGTMAAIQAARMGSSVIIAEETPWLGGMLTAAGVSAIDGNYKLKSGLWEEFRNNLYEHYGGPEMVKTGWVSNVLFEPQVGDSLLKKMVDEEEEIALMINTVLTQIEKTGKTWKATLKTPEETLEVTAKLVIDATELGDVATMVGIPYDIGMDSKHVTQEEIAPEKANNIVQDLTYVAILKDFGEGNDMTIPRPAGYDPTVFYCTCAGRCSQDSVDRKLWDCNHMMEYGRLPNKKYMINWPISGNDFYLNVIEMSPSERLEAYRQAKWHTMCYVYYLQQELGFRHLGIADDVFPTADGLPFIPYHRESRRIRGMVRFDLNDLSQPFEQEDALYRTGIAVGDYPVDHHHDAYSQSDSLPDLYFYPVPSYALPLGTLIPTTVSDFIVAEKSISVTNLVNGTTRLQPVCMLIGQAAGALAALALNNGQTPAEVPVRSVQKALLDFNAYLLPYLDVTPDSKFFKAIQKTGATGILRGEGKNVGWENQTLFYPDSLLSRTALQTGLADIAPELKIVSKEKTLSCGEALTVIHQLMQTHPGEKTKDNDEQTEDQTRHDDKQPEDKNQYRHEQSEERAPRINQQLEDKTEDSNKQLGERAASIWSKYEIGSFDKHKPITRAEFCLLLDELVNPFTRWKVNHDGNFDF